MSINPKPPAIRWRHIRSLGDPANGGGAELVYRLRLAVARRALVEACALRRGSTRGTRVRGKDGPS